MSKEQMTWQLEQIKDKGVAGSWYYPRYVRGEAYGPHPEYWSDGWWELFEHYVAEHKRLGLTVWFADWTGQGGWQELLRGESKSNPDLQGYRLVCHETEALDGAAVEMAAPDGDEVLSVAAWRKSSGAADGDTFQDLTGQVTAGKLTWQAPDGDWIVAMVCSQLHDLDYLNPHTAARWLELYWEPHADRLGEFMGEALRGYLQDEIYVLGGNIVYAESLLTRFQADKGYDPRRLLAGLFHDIGDMTDKIRCEYYEVMSILLEENLYRPLSDWHEERGLQFSTIATWGRQCMLGQTYQYGDIFRLCRWFHITGNEDPGHTEPGGRCFIDAKLASSVQHLYDRDRAAVCVYWGSGHGMTQEENVSWTNENYAYGINMYNTHGGLYGSLGSWYEWVPPSVHFRQPYWEHWGHFTGYISRLSALMSQGAHRADVALLYPQSTIHANWLRGDHFTALGDESALAGYSLSKQIYEYGIDFDYIDDLKLNEGECRDGTLFVGDLEFRAVLLPPMTTIRTDTLEKIKAFYDAGGTVMAVRRLPSASAEHGRNDPYIRELLLDIFGIPSSAEYIHTSAERRQGLGSVKVHENASGGKAIFMPEQELHRNHWWDPMVARDVSTVPAFISRAIDRDVVASGDNIFHTHQKVGALDVYFLYNVLSEKRAISVEFRIVGDPEIWDAFTSEIIPHHRFESVGNKTKVRLDIERNQGVLVVFRAGARAQVVEDNLTRVVDVQPATDAIQVDGRITTGGMKQVRVQRGGRAYVGEARVPAPPPPAQLDGDWGFELVPTMDNRWGDWRWPASDTMVSAEAREFRYHTETDGDGTALNWHTPEFDDVAWPDTVYSFGPYWHELGPFTDGSEPDPALFLDGTFDLAAGCEAAGETVHWKEHSYSRIVGHASGEVYCAHAGVHGIDDHFIFFPATGGTVDAWHYLFTWVSVPAAGDWEFHFGHGAPGQEQHDELWSYHLGTGDGAGQQVWINGEKAIELVDKEKAKSVSVHLKEGLNTVLLKVLHHEGQAIDVFAAFQDIEATVEEELPPPPRLKWFLSGETPLHDITPQAVDPVGWYRFEAPAGTTSMKLQLDGEALTAWVDGKPVVCEARASEIHIALKAPTVGVTKVALRIRQKPGCYAGAAILTPVEFTCVPTSTALGDWSENALASYSGGAVYSKDFDLTAAQLETEIILDLGLVKVSAEVEVNGEVVGIGLARPFQFDISDYVREGQNHLKVTVYNTIANHYNVAFPSSYVFEGQTVSGLIGPVTLQFAAKISLTARPVE